jgi:RNA polymerase sigma factor (sigma-70 family)
MAQEPLRVLIRQLRQLTGPSGDGGLPDGQLLERFVSQRDEAAFELLVWRHGAMVLSLCRRLLRHEQDAEDAFQATFLILARKAASIGKREAVASWLYKVAYRVALAARKTTARHGTQALSLDVPAREEDDLVWRDLRPVLDEEVSRLPERYRTPFVLCYLEGKTNEEAAEMLGCPKGTVLSRLSRARERLRKRLARRGLALTAGALATVVADRGQAAVLSAEMVENTVKAALAVAAGQAAAAVSSQAAALMEGVLRAMFLNKVKAILGIVVMVGVLGLTTGLLGQSLGAGGKGNPPPAVDEPAPPGRGEEPARATRETGKTRPETDDPIKAAARRRQSANNLKRIALALHNYHDTNGTFPPPAIYDKSGKPLLSWRVLILPYIEQDNLYKQFRLDETWDSEHNKKLLEQMPRDYAPVGERRTESDRTYYQALVGTGAAFEPRKALGLKDFLDGTSNIIIVVEAETPVPWTKPEDLPYVPDQALPKLGGLFGGDFHVLFADGSVQFVSRKADESVLRSAITRAAGEVSVDRSKLSVGRGLGGDPLGAVAVAQENEQLKRAIETTRAEVEKTKKEVEKTKKEVELRKARLAYGAPQMDEKTLEMLQQNEELKRVLDNTLHELERLKTDRDQLQKELEQLLKKK